MNKFLVSVILLPLFVIAQTEPVLKFENPYIFAPMKGSSTTAGYASIKNISKKDVQFSVTSASPFAAVETHQTIEKEGLMSMKKVDRFTIKANSQIDLKPGANHIMLFDANRDVKIGEQIEVKLNVNGKEMTQKFKVIPREKPVEPSHHSH